ncbi:hypothetical protein [Paenibacillus soyae]|uniref:Uncharacterized protein n=1 Tax=Paenibacillus soyae TaxID=2969249 RepID=A0A9X2MTG5_9BACL|nr:hypothetical protein [Paenibacillus soyae]MCR2806514.1 hypothetical protein [Paenibacillus soyae]
MFKQLRNEKGLTLVEVLGVLVLTVLILGSLIYMLQYSSLGTKQVSEREQTLQQSRDIMNHIVGTVRIGLIPPSLESRTGSNLRLEDVVEGQFADYKFDAATNTLTVEYQLKNDAGELASEPATHTFSNKVKNIVFHTFDSKVEVTLEMYLPNNQVHTTSTTVYSPNS